MKKKCEEFKVERPDSNQYVFKAKNYDLSIPRTSKDNKYNYPSERSAKSAAEDEFRNLCYSSSACKPMVKKIFVEYRVDKLKPFYDTEDQPETYYYRFNEIIRKYLADAYAEICCLLGENILPDTWKDFSCYLSDKKSCFVEFLENFEEKSQDYDVISMIEKDSRDFQSPGIEQYLLNFDYDSTEEYAGTGMFGSAKWKEKWNFTGFRDAAKEFIDDVYWKLQYFDDEIMDKVEYYIDGACSDYEDKIKEMYMKKIEEIEQIIK